MPAQDTCTTVAALFAARGDDNIREDALSITLNKHTSDYGDSYICTDYEVIIAEGADHMGILLTGQQLRDFIFAAGNAYLNLPVPA